MNKNISKRALKMAFSLIVLTLLSLIPVSAALSVEDFTSRINGLAVPKEASKYVNKIKVNGYLDEKFYYAGTIEDGKIKLLSEKFDKPVIEVYTSTKTLDKIINSEDLELEAYKAYKNKEIKIVGKGLFNKLKLMIAEKILKKEMKSRYGNKI